MVISDRVSTASARRGEGSQVDPSGSAAAARRYPMDFDDRLAEEAVLLAVDRAAAAVRASFHEERDLLYELSDEDFREQRFRALHASWFVSLRLGETLRAVLAAEPSVVAGTRRCRVLRAAHRGGEYADLTDSRTAEGEVEDTSRPVLVIRVRPRTLLDAERSRHWLRRELLHVADLLDPSFGFDRSASLSAGEPGLEKLIRERYRLLWEVTVDARLAAAGDLPPGSEERRLREFRAAFPMLGEPARGAFERLFRGPRPSHAELVALARDPRSDDRGGSGAGRCPVCSMPSYELARGPQLRAPGLAAAVRRSAPGWAPADGICRQCLDLFLAAAWKL